jgi:hypothetical protein
MCGDNKIYPVRRHANGIQILSHIIEEMHVTRIYENLELPVDKIRIAIILCIGPPYEGMETIKYFHNVFLLPGSLC